MTPKKIYLLAHDLEFIEKNKEGLYLVDASKVDVLGSQIKYLSEQSVNQMLAEKDEKIASLELKLREKYKQGYSDGVKDWENTYLNNNKK